jgi:hypothetical protein
MSDIEHRNDPESEKLLTRRAVLKVIAGAPLFVTFGLATSPLMRYLKPTMKPGNFLQASDQPMAAEPVPMFHQADLPNLWTCLPFMFSIKYMEFNPEQYEVREIPAFVIRTGVNKIVAYSRYCPVSSTHRHILNFAINPADNCHCGHNSCICSCRLHTKNPVLVCPCDGSVFDLANDARVIAGPARRPPREMTVEHNGDFICITHLEPGGIA